MDVSGRTSHAGAGVFGTPMTPKSSSVTRYGEIAFANDQVKTKKYGMSQIARRDKTRQLFFQGFAHGAAQE